MKRRSLDEGQAETPSIAAILADGAIDRADAQSHKSEIEQPNSSAKARNSCHTSSTSRDDVNSLAGALTVLNGRHSFWQPASHEHFAKHEEGRVSDARD